VFLFPRALDASRHARGSCGRMQRTQGVTTSAAVGRGRKRLRRAEHLLATIVSDFAREPVRPLVLRDAIGHLATPQPFHRAFVGWLEMGAQPLWHRLGGAVLHQRAPLSLIGTGSTTHELLRRIPNGTKISHQNGTKNAKKTENLRKIDVSFWKSDPK